MHTSCGCVIAASSRAHSITSPGSRHVPRMPSGLMRISAPFAWLSGLERPVNPAAMVAPQSKGSDSSQATYARRTSSRSYLPCSTSVRASASAISESSVGWPASVLQVPPSASSRTPSGYVPRIAWGVSNSTRLPSASPASCPSRQPCARSRIPAPSVSLVGAPVLGRTTTSAASSPDSLQLNCASARSSNSKTRPSSSAAVRPRRPSRQR